MEEQQQQSPQLRRPFTRKKQLKQDIIHITDAMYKRNRELAEINRTLSLLRTIDTLVLESHTSLKMVCENITQAIALSTDYSFVGLLTRSAHTQDQDEVTLYGSSGNSILGAVAPVGLARPLRVSLSHEWYDKPQGSKLLSLEGLTSLQMAELLGCTEEDIKALLEKLPLKSLYVVKLRARRRLVGLLVIGFLDSIKELVESDTSLMDSVSDSVGVALDNKLLFEENQFVLRQLKDTNAKLKALDEAKDDFISMASHQLRTPLTSVKGYLSMVMEGDAGTINKAQQEMLGQAFFSSQRMVYLIADLLNVSRLRTGKFIIDAVPVNLSLLVQEEIIQLSETIKSHRLTVGYDQPKDFPMLMIDETKTRQVIMNFIDNAIYYTPAGGHIEVRLLNNQSSIELRVEDSGIGVPKDEQQHLFTKFYRAGNARKARPDGTGLGLFMAKKVVVAQGGSIIFESKEGKGSTFGFVFSKAKLAVESAQVTTPDIPVSIPKS